MSLFAEAIPPEAGPPLVAFGMLCGYVAAFGLIYVLYRFTRAVGGGFKIAGVKIPGLSSIMPSPVNAVFHWMESEMSQALIGLDAKIGYFFARQPLIVQQMEKTAWGDALAVYGVAKWAVAKLGSASLGGQVFKQQQTKTKAAGAQAATATHTAKVAIGRTDALGRYARNNIGAATAELPGVISRDLPNLRDQVQAAEDAISRLWKRVRGNVVGLGSLAFTGAAVWALTRIGAGWLRCSNWRKIGRAGCNLPINMLESLLALVTDFLILTNICTVIPWLEAAFSEVAGPLIAELTKVGAGLCGGASSRAPELPVPTLYLPATVDATLYLP